MHQFLGTFFSYYLPMASISFSLMYSFSQKKRIRTNRSKSVNNRITAPSTVPSIIEDSSEDGQSDRFIQASGEQKKIDEYQSFLMYWEEGAGFNSKQSRL